MRCCTYKLLLSSLLQQFKLCYFRMLLSENKHITGLFFVRFEGNSILSKMLKLDFSPCNQSCIEFKKFTRSSNELTFNSSSKFPSLSFMYERKERNFELELKVSSIELLLNFLNFIQL